MNAQIVKLEAEKKKAASSKKFKEASKAQADIKDVSSQIDTQQNHLEMKT